MDVLTFDDEPIRVPRGPLTDGTKERIESAVAMNLPEGKHLAIIAVLDKSGPRFGSVVKIGEHWKFAADWDGKHEGSVGIVAVF